jgi:hypothetical protein
VSKVGSLSLLRFHVDLPTIGFPRDVLEHEFEESLLRALRRLMEAFAIYGRNLSNKRRPKLPQNGTAR